MQTDTNQKSTIQQHPNLYFQDGDVILSAPLPSDKGTTLLRVHRVVLSHHSPVFKDMFAFPSNPQVNEMLDGVPVVRMPDDGDELAGLISAFYNPESLAFSRNVRYTYTYQRMRSLLSLATKYQVDGIRRRIVEFVKEDWPQDLEEWHLFRAQFDSRLNFSHVAMQGEFSNAAEDYFPEPASALRLAIDFGITSILPAAYYRLAISSVQLQRGEDFDGQGQMSARWDLLERTDWLRLTRGKELLFIAAEDLHAKLSQWVHVSQCKHQKCTNAADDPEHVFGWMLDAEFARKPDLLAKIFESLEGVMETTLCMGCSYQVEEELRKVLADTWDNLPDIFDLRSDTHATL